jgi:hypothetical protein
MSQSHDPSMTAQVMCTAPKVFRRPQLTPCKTAEASSDSGADALLEAHRSGLRLNNAHQSVVAQTLNNSQNVNFSTSKSFRIGFYKPRLYNLQCDLLRRKSQLLGLCRQPSNVSKYLQLNATFDT